MDPDSLDSMQKNASTVLNQDQLRRVLNRAKKGSIWVKSVHFWHFQQLPNSTLSHFGRATASILNQ